VDDHILFAKALLSLISGSPLFISHFGNCEVTLAKNGIEALQLLESRKFDLVLLDLRMPMLNGLQFLETVRLRGLEIKTLVLTMEDDESSIIRAYKNGCNGYLTKDIPPPTLLEAIDSIVRTGEYVTPFISKIINRNNNRENELLKLSEEDKEIIKLFCSDLSVEEIAEKLGHSPKTIHHHRQEIFDKIGVNSRVGLVMYSIKNKIFEII